MRIRLAYDRSSLGQQLDRLDAKHGIARVYDQLLFELSARPDIDLTAVSLCTDDALLGSIKSQLYFEAHKSKVHGRFAPSFRSRLRLTSLYQDTFSSAW